MAVFLKENICVEVKGKFRSPIMVLKSVEKTLQKGIIHKLGKIL